MIGFLLLLAVTPLLTPQQDSGWQSAVTMDGEPHHHLAFQNQYLRAFKVAVAPHSATLLHQHPRDYVFITLGETSLENDVQGRPPVKLQLKDGEVHFTKGGFAHVAKNLSAQPFRNVTVEFSQPVGDLKPPADSAEPKNSGTGCLFGGVMFPASVKTLLSSDVVLVRGYSLPRKCGLPVEAKGTLVVALSPVVINHAKAPTASLKRGDLAWLRAEDAIVNRHAAAARFITIEFQK
jgi:hypothetical protein